MKRFFYASVAVLMLAIAYHLGATTATAQSLATPVGIALNGDGIVVMDQNGELFYQELISSSSFSKGVIAAHATYMGNFWTGARRASK